MIDSAGAVSWAMRVCRRLSLLVIAVLVAGGCVRTSRRPAEGRVVALWAGATAASVERSVVISIETGFAGMPGIAHVDSASRTGVGEGRAVLQTGTDRAQAR